MLSASAALLLSAPAPEAVEACTVADRPACRLTQQGLADAGFDPGVPDSGSGPDTAGSPESHAARRTPPYATYGDPRLAALIEAALENNPQIHEALASWRAELRRLPQVTAKPDPTLMVTQFARSPETRVGPQTTLVSVTQPFPGPGKLRLRGESTSKAAAVRAELVQAQRAAVILQVKQAYYDLAYVDRALEISREEEDLLQQYERLARNRYAQGLGMQGEVVRLQAEITRVVSRREELQWLRVDAEAALNAVLDRAADTSVEPVALAEPPPVALDDAAAIDSASPDVQAAQRLTELRETQVRLARRDQWPDFSVGVAWGNVLGRRDPPGLAMPPASNGKNVYSVMVGVTLPLFRAKYDASVEEAVERAGAARSAHRTTVNESSRAIRSATFRLRTIQRQITLFESALLPQAEQVLLTTEAAYSTGGTGVLELLDGQRMLLDVRLGLARLHADYFRALADRERAAGFAAPKVNPS